MLDQRKAALAGHDFVWISKITPHAGDVSNVETLEAFTPSQGYAAPVSKRPVRKVGVGP